MRQRLLYPLTLAALLWCLGALPALGQSMIDPSDSFDDGVIDTTRWNAYGDPGTSITEAGGKLVLTQEPTGLGRFVVSRADSRYRLRGAFDIEVDYELTEWPSGADAALALCASPLPGDENALQRASWSGIGEFYSAYFNAWTGGQGVSVSTTDMAGKLRLVRDANNVLFGYCWQASTSEWVLLHSATVSADDLVVGLYLLGNVRTRVAIAFDNFRINSGEAVSDVPTVEDVQIDRGQDTDWWDSPMWHERYTVQVKGTKYEQPACILVQDPQGDCKHLPTCGEGFGGCWSGTNPGGSCDFQVTVGPDYTYTYVWYEARKERPIPEGSYQITVYGNAGSQSTLTTAAVPAVPEDVPVLFAPAADGVVDTTAPTFEWQNVLGAHSTLRVRAEGLTSYTGPAPDLDDCGEIWRLDVSPGGPTSAVYNSDGTGPSLDPGRSYFWQISNWNPVDDRVSDPRVAIWNDQTARHRFTVDTAWPGLPELPGHLAYEQTMYGGQTDPYNATTILQYGTTPAERTWVGPDASHSPSYSWDGTKLAYHLSDWGTYVANADGSDPVRLPVTYGWSGPDFSPDAEWLVFADGESQGGVPQHIYIQRPFASDRTLLVWARGDTTRLPRWSPDGKWITYLSCCDPSGNNIWMIHPDGTEDHPVLPTTLAGYPGWTITWLGSSVVWSPDAARLGVNFNARSADGSDVLDGVGTISADGGELTPVFINPPGHVCCAVANALCWSPDGGSLVFNSAHHLPADPNWANGALATGIELWMGKADGTGEPIRLTYDYSHNLSAAWWAPNTPVGSDVSVVKGEATLTFAQVTAEGSTRMNIGGGAPGLVLNGYRFASEVWNGATTAGYQGDITVALKYDASLVGQENRLALMEWNTAKAKWQDITVRPLDTTNRIIRGQTRSLSNYAVCVASHAPWLDPNDSFDGTAIDTTRWQTWSEPGTSVTETGGKLVLTDSPTALGREVGTGVVSTYRLSGAFDIQVDYDLTQWPANNDVSIALCASPRPWDENALQRTSWTGGSEAYNAAFNAWTDPTWIAVPTTDTSGKLRLVRDAGNVLSDYYWQADTSEWVLIGSHEVSDADFVVILYIWGNVFAPATVTFDNFQVNSGHLVPPPAITNIQIDRGRDADWWDFSYWHTRYVVQAQGSGDEQPVQVWLQDMQGLRQVINLDGSHWYDPAGPNPGGSWEDARVFVGPDETYNFVWYEARQQHPIPAGSYTITVVGAGGSQTSLTTAEVPAVPDAVPTLLGPADQSVTETAVPTFEWLPLLGTKGILQVREEGNTTYTTLGPDQDDCGEIWRTSIEGQQAAVYNFDGTGPDLDPGRTYFWQVDEWTPVDDRVSDPRVSVWNSQTSRHRLTVDTTWPALPALPGKLAYEQTMYGDGNDPYNLQAILQYGTTPAQRKWVGPDGSHLPSYSWDGTKIAYRVSDWGAHIANADGSGSVQVPGNWDWDSTDFSPDATWITYSDGESQGSAPQHVYIQKLSESTRTLVVRARGNTTRGTHWSPDGKWIVYLSCCDPSGYNVWLVHPDGTQDHPVVPTTLAGYPGWTITWLGSAVVWSPNATRLGVNFNARSADGSGFLDGVGTISADGGELTPVFTNPPGHVCCAAASTLCWSPDGGSLVFSSTHHLPVDPNWANGGLVPGAELWMSSADGSRTPTRLTYDYSSCGSAAWWAHNTLVGRGVAVVKGDATVTFAQVTVEGSTRMNVTGDVPGPAPTGYRFVSDVWNGATTASYQGDITVALKYDVSLAGQEDMLALMEWNAAKGKWQSITAHPIDTVNHIIRGQTKGLGSFVICLRTG